jgi:hypothetical protein
MIARESYSFPVLKRFTEFAEKKYLQLFSIHFIEEETGGWDVIEES